MPKDNPEKVLPVINPEIYRSVNFENTAIYNHEHSDMESLSLKIADLVMSALVAPHPEESVWEEVAGRIEFTRKPELASYTKPTGFTFSISYEDYAEDGATVVYEITVHYPNGSTSKIWTTAIFHILPSIEDGSPVKYTRDIVIGATQEDSSDTKVVTWGDDIGVPTQMVLSNTIDDIHDIIWSGDYVEMEPKEE